jgi:hypothetical protein
MRPIAWASATQVRADTGEFMRDEAQHRAEDAQHRATEFVKELYAAGDIDAGRLDASVTEILAATTEARLAEVVRSLPPPVALTSADRRLTKPLEIHSGIGRLRLTGRWQVGKETHVSADLGSITIDLSEAEFDDNVIDLHVYTGCGSVTIIVPRGVGVQMIRHRGGLSSRLEPPVPGLPLIRLDLTTNIGRIRLRHPVSTSRPPKGVPR